MVNGNAYTNQREYGCQLILALSGSGIENTRNQREYGYVNVINRRLLATIHGYKYRYRCGTGTEHMIKKKSLYYNISLRKKKKKDERNVY